MGLAPPGEKGEIMLFNYTVHGEEMQLHESKAAGQIRQWPPNLQPR